MTNGIRVLIVEDEFLIALHMETSLMELGHTVCGTTSSGEDAVRLAREEEPDVVIIDINLQGEMDGIETAGRIRSFSTTAVIFVTGYSDRDLKSRAEEMKPLAYFIKPVSVDQIISAFNKVRL